MPGPLEVWDCWSFGAVVPHIARVSDIASGCHVRKWPQIGLD